MSDDVMASALHRSIWESDVMEMVCISGLGSDVIAISLCMFME